MGKALCVAASLAVILVAAGCQFRPPVDDAEKELVLRAADLAPFGYGLEDTEPHEVFTKTRLFGVQEIDYEFEAPKSKTAGALYLSVTLTFERNRMEAALSHGIEKTAIMAGLRAAGIEPREMKDFSEYGDRSTLYILEESGRPVGNLFSVLDGSKSCLIILSGFYFDDPAEWKELVQQKLERFSAYDPA